MPEDADVMVLTDRQKRDLHAAIGSYLGSLGDGFADRCVLLW